MDVLQLQPPRARAGQRALVGGARRALAPAAIWLVAVLAARLVGFETTIPWSHFQILDRPLLEARPFASLWLLHQQPPLFNALLAACLRAAALLGTSPELVLGAVHLVVGLGTVLLFTALVERVSGSRRLALVGAAAMVVDPAFHYYGTLGWYPFLVRSEVVLFAYAAARALEDGRRRHLALAFGALLLLSLTRTLFHPAFSLGAAALLSFLVLRRHRSPGAARRLAPLGLVFLALLALWPLKNLVVFGQFTYSSITAINLARVTTGVDQGEWLAYFNHGHYGPEVAARIEQFRDRYGEELATLVASPEKFDGSRNWNHLTALHVGPELARKAREWRRQNLRTVALIAGVQYFMWARPAFVQSYTGHPRGPDDPAYQGYARAYQAALFTDVRPLVEAATPGLGFHKMAILWRDGSPLVYTLFGLLWFPLVAGAAALSLLQRARRRSVAGGMVLLSLYAVSWTLAVPILTDGIEANRMRFSTGALFTLLLLDLVGRVLRRRRA